MSLLQLVMDRGQLASPRTLPASAIHDVTIQVADPVAAPPVGIRDGYAPRIGATEAVHLLAGVSDLGQLDAASNGGFTRFADGGRLRGAYGPRLARQLPRIERQLRRDQATRQAVAVIWRPGDDLEVKDVPCTVSLTFRVVADLLELKVHMRSNDLVLGVPYDWFQFSRLQLVMAEVLGLRAGRYVHHVDDLHVYQRDEGRALKFRDHGELLERDGQLGLIPQAETVFSNRGHHPFNSWVEVRTAAVSVLYGRDSAYRRFRWYHDHVTPLADTKVICSSCRYVFTRGEVNPIGRTCGECGVSA